MKTYNKDFFEFHFNVSTSSAHEIIPIIIEYVQPTSVIDVGCGNGTWLAVWEKHGIADITGVDGDYVNVDELLIDKKYFIPFNLEKGFTSDRKYSLVTCLEVAEHINPNSAENFIKSLCNLGDIIAFSAAIPGQEGTLHVNEQYPEYWIALFAKNDFVPIDSIRKRIWNNQKISWWYRQNIFFFIRKNQITGSAKFQKALESTDTEFVNIIHPELFKNKLIELDTYRPLIRNPLKLAKYLVEKGFKKIKRKYK
jgi:SAM-dependent methyltransferase